MTVNGVAEVVLKSVKSASAPPTAIATTYSGENVGSLDYLVVSHSSVTAVLVLLTILGNETRGSIARVVPVTATGEVSPYPFALRADA